MGSTRLPGKMAIPFFEGKTILEIIIERLKSSVDIPIIIATSVQNEDDFLERLSRNLDVKCFRGSERDVLSRFINAAEFYKFEKIIRVCADNPYIDPHSLIEMSILASENEYDYISYMVNNKPSIKTHFGFWAENVTLNCLKRVLSLTNDMKYHEHVTNFIYEHPDLFKIKWLDTPLSVNGRDDIRLTIDTKADFINVQQFFNFTHKFINELSIDGIVKLLDNNSNFLNAMKTEISKNLK